MIHILPIRRRPRRSGVGGLAAFWAAFAGGRRVADGRADNDKADPEPADEDASAEPPPGSAPVDA